jgi:hypothetical protein
MEQSIVQRKQPPADGVIQLACREPGRAVTWLPGSHLVVPRGPAIVNCAIVRPQP